ncbi:MAG: hypothetical protein L6247_02760 [Desulfobacteraceae bacterium]|nr:hypothetical protein [Thermodesulfovibrionales bacterium]MCG2754483.1 hypothetical protein [Desulfobacteraceae bacterium]
MSEKISEKTVSLANRENFQGNTERPEIRCKALDIGLESFVVCLEETPWTCTHSFHFGGKHFCKWPARVHAAKTCKK